MPSPRFVRCCLIVGTCVTSLLAPRLVAQTKCDSTCSPDPTSPTYTSGTVKARPLPKNQRGSSSALAGVSRIAGDGTPSLPLPGSTSFTYTVPILHLPGRNGLDVDLTLYYNSAIWTVDVANNRVSFNADRDFPGYGFRLGYGMIEGPFNNDIGTTSYMLTEPDGTKRELRLVSGTTYESFDNTFIDYDSSTRTLYRKDGTQWQYTAVPGSSTFSVPTQIKDTNGNYISITYNTSQGFNAQAINTITDTLGRVITFNYNPTTHLPSSINAPVFGGTTGTIATFTWTAVPLNYSFTLPVVDTVPNGTSINVLTKCAYANQTGYQFVYGDWGIVKEIDQLSANNTLRAFEAYNFPAATTALSDAPTYTTKTVSADGVSTANWTYQVTKSGLLVSSMAVADPAGTTTTTNLFTTSWQTGLVSSVVVQSGATALRTITNTWTQDNTAVNYKTNPRLANVLTTLNDSGQQSQVLFSYTTYGNVSQVQELDYGLGLVRTTQTDYLASPAYVTQHILDRPLQVRIYNASVSLVARTDFAYDGPLPTLVSGAGQHDDANYGSSFNTRGNLTSTTRYPSLPSTTPTILRNFTYDTLGNLLTAQADCCNLEQWFFSVTTKYAYPDSIKRGPNGGPQLTTTRTYDFNTGLLTSETDPNQQTNTYGYDSMKRLTSINRPLGANATVSYDDNVAQPAATTTSALDATNNLVQVTTTDGLGRRTKQEIKSGAGTSFSIVETQYDVLSRVTQVSNPHGPTESPVWTVNSYNDGLGRLTSVMPPGNAGSSQFAYSGNTVTVTDPAGKQRRTYTDALGRIVRVDEPSWSDSGQGTGWVIVSGSEQSVCDTVCDPNCRLRACVQYDSGSVSMTVGSLTATTIFNQTSDSNGIAQNLADGFNSSPASPVTATVTTLSPTDNKITLTARDRGAYTNFSLSASATGRFSPPSFSTSVSGATLTGGSDGGGAGATLGLTTPVFTLYFYDPLNNLTSVAQGAQQRTFVYDSLGRLTRQSTPEGGTVNYTYTDFSTVATRTDARGVVTNYSYEGLNRLQQVSYTVTGTTVPATPTVIFGYDAGGAAANAMGRTTSMTDGVGGETYQYDALGRMTSLAKTINGASYPLGYQYNLAGELTSITYPSGRQVQQTYDAIGRLSQIQSGGTNYLSAITYNAAFQPTAATYGNGVQGSFGYNARLQLASLAYSNAGGTFFSLAYNYGTSNNSQIQSVTDTVDPTKTTTFTYDALARLKTAANGQWSLSWDYDRYGNRKGQNASQVTIDANTNRIVDPGYSHDASGNMTNDTQNALTYDAESRVVTAVKGTTTTNHVYDGNSLRVKKQVVGGTTTVYIFAGAKVIAEYENGALPASPTREYLYSGSQLLTTIEGSATKYHHRDHLSVRVTTDSTGTVIGQQGHLPFGDFWYETGTGTTKWKFTSYERDAESNNDYATFRSYVNRLGRFSSPDPLGGSLADPQSLNRYAYVRNDPVNLIDPLGLVIECTPIFSTGSEGTVSFQFWYCIEYKGLGGGVGVQDQGRSGPGGGGGGPQQPSRTAEVNRCAADLANTASLAALTKTQNVPVVGTLFSNNVSSVSKLVFGPNRLGGAQSVALNASAGDALQGSANIAAKIEVNPGFQSLFTTIAPTTLGRTAVGSVAVNLVKGAASFLNGVVAPVQVLYDAGVYVGALVVCAKQ